MDFDVRLTKRTRRRKTLAGIVMQDRHVLNYRDPHTGKRCQRFFERKRDAEAFAKELTLKVAEGSYVEPKRVPTVAEAVDHWLANRRGQVKDTTLAGYQAVCKAIVGPLLDGTRRERADFAQTGRKPRGAKFIHL